MPDSPANRVAAIRNPTTIAEIVAACEPMGSLAGFVIDDLTEAEEDEFFSILENT